MGMHYNLDLTFSVRIAKWRIDDPSITENAEWSLCVFDRNLGQWVNVNDLNRPGESGMLKHISILKDEDE
jgi:hypothetical protein